jgi:hypothetical protein
MQLAPLLLMAFTTAAAASPQLEKLFAKPLIIGASVSADWGTQSPGKRLALRYTHLGQIKSFAKGGRPGVETLRAFPTSGFDDRSVILGLDLFFWDSTLPSVEATLTAMSRLFEISKELQIPLVLGDIPELIPGYQPHRTRLNRELHERCRKALCTLMPFDRLHRQVLHDRFFEVKGKKYTLDQIVPDGLHLSADASDELADRLREEILKP